MTDRKFTPPTEFPAEYVDSEGEPAVILGIGPNEVYPYVGYDCTGDPCSWTEDGRECSYTSSNGEDLHDIPKRITTWHNVYGDLMSAGFYTRSAADEVAYAVRLCVYRIERDEDGGNPEIFVEEV